MYFESVEEQARIEGIISRIEFMAEEQGYSDYRHCIMKASSEFFEILLEEAWDIITLTALELYENSVKGRCKAVRHYKYEIDEKTIIYYRVTKREDIALFEVEEMIILGVKL